MVDKGWAYTLLLYILSFIQLSLHETNEIIDLLHSVCMCM